MGDYNSFIQQQAIEVPHGDIQPKTIHFSNSGEIKLLPPQLINSSTGYAKMLRTGGVFEISKKSKNSEDPKMYKACLSPLLLQALKKGETTPRHDLFSSDVWSLGISILSCCNLRNFKEYYDYDGGIVNYALIQKDYLKMLKSGFSEELVNCLEKCLQETETRRAKLDWLDDEIQRLSSMNIGLEENKENLQIRGNQCVGGGNGVKVKGDSILSGIGLKMKVKDDFWKKSRVGGRKPLKVKKLDFGLVGVDSSKKKMGFPIFFEKQNFKRKKRSLSLSSAKKSRDSKECSRNGNFSNPLMSKFSQPSSLKKSSFGGRLGLKSSSVSSFKNNQPCKNNPKLLFQGKKNFLGKEKKIGNFCAKREKSVSESRHKLRRRPNPLLNNKLFSNN